MRYLSLILYLREGTSLYRDVISLNLTVRFGIFGSFRYFWFVSVNTVIACLVSLNMVSSPFRF